MNYIQITIQALAAELKDILIARLSEEGFEGFEEEEGRLHAFIPEERFEAAALDALLAEGQLHYERIDLPKTNWNEEWEKNFPPVVVDGFCGVRAYFHEPAAGVEYDLVITPKMSFGTGHHATTYMMLRSMRHLDIAGKTVLDFGTGTGVLAILAEKIGAARVLAIDHDDWCIENARENVLENLCTRISVEKMETIPDNELFFIILANINKNVILAELDAMRQHLSPGGVIVLSGLLQEDLADIGKKAAQYNLTISGRMTKDNWLCLQLERPDGK